MRSSIAGPRRTTLIVGRANAGERRRFRAIEQVAMRLGNTPAISRKSYVHPLVLEAYVDGQTLRMYKERAEETLRDAIAGLQPEEAAVLAFLRDRLSREIAEQKKIA